MRKLLFISPAVPIQNGLGIEKRAFQNLRALSKVFDVDLLIVAPDHALTDDRLIDARRLAADILTAPTPEIGEGLFAATKRIRPKAVQLIARALYPRPAGVARYAISASRRAARLVAGRSYDALHCFRLSMAPTARLALAALAHPPKWRVLDIDDIESEAQREGAETQYAELGFLMSFLLKAEAFKLKRFESKVLSRFDAVCVCSDLDRGKIEARTSRLAAFVVPNCVDAPDHVAPRSGGRGDEILFVGSLHYEPNQNGLVRFCRDIFPRIRDVVNGDVRLKIVGRRAPPRIRRLGEIDGVDFIGEVADLAPCYDRADLAIAPIYAGGGTRIKILESFGYAVPVVSTSKGAEGLGAADGRELLLAETDCDFAQACASLLADPATGARIGAAGRAFLEGAFAPARVEIALKSVYGKVIG